MSDSPIKFHRGEIYKGPDNQGRYHFALFWWADYHPGDPQGEYGRRERGQHFRGPLPKDVRFKRLDEKAKR